MNNPTSGDNRSDAQKTESAQSRVDIPGGQFQRPGQQPMAARMPGAYPGSYPGVPGYGSATANDPRTANGRKLIIGEGITLSGEIESCDHLIVEGTVEAALKGASAMDIAESGVFYGTVEINEATVAGRFEGDLTVNGRLTVRASGSITGTIAYKELAIEAGAILDGKISPLGAAKGERGRVTEGNFKGKQKGGHQNNENQLPFVDKAAATAAE